MQEKFDDAIRCTLEVLQNQDNLRALNAVEDRPTHKIDLTSNDYLNLKFDKQNLRAGYNYAKTFGNSFSASRVIGNNRPFLELETLLAKVKKKSHAIVFPTGFQLNSTIIPAILGAFSENETSVFADKLNHSSMQNGIRQSKHKQYRYRHADMNHLEDLLKKNKKKHNFVFTEGVFSMDGTILSIADIKTLKQKYNFYLYVDDAHGFGVLGKNGFGVCDDNEDVVDFAAGTLSKAVGSQGGYICCGEGVFKIAVNKATGLIYSTGLNPFSIGVALQSIRSFSAMANKRVKIQKLTRFLHSELKKINPSSQPCSKSHIIPILINAQKMTKEEIVRFFWQKSINIAVIKSPTVPLNKERIRLSITASHAKKDIMSTIEAIKEFLHINGSP